MSLVVQLEFKVRPGKETEFLRLARALADAAATEPGTLRYQWYVTPRAGHYSILEEYVNADAAKAHNEHVAPLLREIFGVVELVSAAIYGASNQWLRDWVANHDGVEIHEPL
jgi:quinol monooxygenase YgiN